MKKILKITMIVFLLCILLLPEFFVKASTIEVGLKEFLGDNYKEKIQKNTASAQNIEKMQSIIRNNNLKTQKNITEYPDYIGGFYIDKNDNIVVIQVLKDAEPTKVKSQAASYDLFQNILSVDKTARIEYVENSYNEINDVIDVLEEYYSENYENGYIDAYYDDIVNNRVVVELKDYSMESINSFKKNVIDSPIIHFSESRNIVDYASFKSGEGIPTLGCSIGFRAKLNSADGFVTAAHCVSGVNEVVPVFGTVKKYRRSGNVDAAWIDLNVGTTIINALYNNPVGLVLSAPLNNTPVTSFVVGQLYGKSGAYSYYTYGYIEGENASGSGGLTGLVKTSIYATHGDSGGIVVKITGTGNLPVKFQTAGIVQGGPAGGGDMNFTRASSIVSAFGVTTY